MQAGVLLVGLLEGEGTPPAELRRVELAVARCEFAIQRTLAAGKTAARLDAMAREQATGDGLDLGSRQLAALQQAAAAVPARCPVPLRSSRLA